MKSLTEVQKLERFQIPWIELIDFKLRRKFKFFVLIKLIAFLFSQKPFDEKSELKVL